MKNFFVVRTYMYIHFILLFFFFSGNSGAGPLVFTHFYTEFIATHNFRLHDCF